MKIIENSEPSKRKRFNKNKKKAWRKKIDVSDIDKAFEDKRREERFGGPLEERVSEDLFSLDVTSNYSDKRTSSTLKCHQYLEGLPGAKAISKKGPEIRQQELRKLKAARQRSGHELKKVVKRNRAEQQRQANLKTKKKEKQFNKDLWSNTEDRLGPTKEVRKSFLAVGVKHFEKQTKKSKMKTPTVRYQKPSLLPAVVIPHSGASYNPSLADHQKLLSKAVVSEKKRKAKERQQQKLFGNVRSVSEGPLLESEKLAEQAEGLPFLEHSSQQHGSRKKMRAMKNEINEKMESKAKNKLKKTNKTDSALKTESQKSLPAKANKNVKIEETTQGYTAPKTNKKSKQIRRKETLRRIEEHKRLKSKRIATSENAVYKIKSLKKEMNQMNKKMDEIIRKKVKQNEKEKLKTKRLSKYKFVEETEDVPLGPQISDSLRQIKPIKMGLENVYKNLQRRNIIETRGKRNTSKRRVVKIWKKKVKENMDAFVKSLNDD